MPLTAKQHYAAELKRIRLDWEELGKDHDEQEEGKTRHSNAIFSVTTKRSAKETIKAWGPKYRKFQDVVMGIAS